MNLSWYNTLNKPFFTPPSWIFGPAWAILYLLIAISGILILRKGIKKKKIKKALQVFAFQLGLNLIWSPIFFGLHQTFLAFIVILMLWYFIFRTIQEFHKIDITASYFLWPYLLWVTFAGVLNFSVWLLNK